MNDPATSPDSFKAVDFNTPVTFSWSAQHLPASDVVRVVTILHGETWTTTDVHRGFNNLGWGENALLKRHGSMQDGTWSAAIGVLTWNTSPADPTLETATLPGGKLQLTWPFGTLLQAPSVAGPWTPSPPRPHTSSPRPATPTTGFWFTSKVRDKRGSGALLLPGPVSPRSRLSVCGTPPPLEP